MLRFDLASALGYYIQLVNTPHIHSIVHKLATAALAKAAVAPNIVSVPLLRGVSDKLVAAALTVFGLKPPAPVSAPVSSSALAPVPARSDAAGTRDGTREGAARDASGPSTPAVTRTQARTGQQPQEEEEEELTRGQGQGQRDAALSGLRVRTAANNNTADSATRDNNISGMRSPNATAQEQSQAMKSPLGLGSGAAGRGQAGALVSALSGAIGSGAKSPVLSQQLWGDDAKKGEFY